MKNVTKTANLRLRQARFERKWSQQELADGVGVTLINVSRWETGETFPSPYFRQKLSEVFGKSLAELGLLHPPRSATSVWNIPIARSPYFTGREPLLALLHVRLSTSRAAALTQPQALFGLGGIGKTRAAAEYVYRWGDEYTHVFWMHAATRETLAADFVALADHLKLPGKEKENQSQIIASIKRWLAAHEGWLLVMDNADDLPLAREFLPAYHKGYVLYTTRAQASGALAASVEIVKLTPQEGALLLLRWTKRLDADAPLEQARDADRAAAERIVREVDGLPLALVQAAAYMEETGRSLEDYHRLYATHRKDLLARSSRLILDYPYTVAATWSLAFEQIEEQSPAAADLLRLCAFLAPDAIPEDLLVRGAVELGAILGPALADPFKLSEVQGILLRYSLIRWDGDAHMLSIHRLVQAVLKDSMDEETQRAWAERTVRAINAAFPESDYGVGEHYQDFVPHVQECAALIMHYHLHFPESGQLLYKAGAFLYFHGFYSQSQSLHEQALAIRQQVFGPEHPTVAESLSNLGVLYRDLGDYEQAERFHWQALAIREKSFGPDHPATTQSLNNLGVLYRNQGKYEQAEQLLKQAHSIHEQSNGSEHPKTLMTILNLAKLYAEQGKYEQAKHLLNQVLTTSKRVMEFGPSLTVLSLALLAKVSFEQGDHEQAESLWQQSLTISEKTFGPEHPTTAERLNELAHLYAMQGRYAQAQALCQRALSICEKTLGPEHPDTIAYRDQLLGIMSKKRVKQNDDHHSASLLR